MRLTSSFAVFRADPEEQDLAKARWLAREGRAGAAEREYRDALAQHPDLATGWMELFELVRRDGRADAALAVAEAAARHFGPAAAMPLALKGAALVELGRTREAITALEASLERDANLALAWHELAYAAYRVGEHPRALLALDRAFALEPHTDTLMLRGRILREAGQFEAAEVAFEAALQATDHDIPQRDAQREVGATRRAAALGGRRPKQFTTRERAFVETGTVVLAGVGHADIAALAGALTALGALGARIGWHPAAVAGATADDARLAAKVAGLLGAPVVTAAALDPADRPVIVTVVNTGGEEWERQLARLERWRSGMSFALVQLANAWPPADVAGAVRPAAEAASVLEAARAALAETAPGTLDIEEAAALAASAEAPWRRRLGR